MPSIRKKEVAKLLLEYCKRQGRGRLTKREYEISEKIHLLNHKGKIRFRKMRTFGTGATRDSVNGKPDFEGYLSPIVIEAYGAYMLKHQTQADGKIRGSDNWMLGIPKEQYIKSAWRHFLDVWLEQRGYKSRDGLDEALGGLLFNVMGYWFEVLKARALALRAEAQK